jgi:hypothetical protein
MNGATVTTQAVLDPNPGPTWHAIGAADVNGDGTADIVWQNTDSVPSVWLMNGTTVTAQAAVAAPGCELALVRRLAPAAG